MNITLFTFYIEYTGTYTICTERTLRCLWEIIPVLMDGSGRSVWLGVLNGARVAGGA